MTFRLALATCSDLPGGDSDDILLVEALHRIGIETSWVVWDAPDADPADFDAVLLRSTWDYQRRRDQFLAWCHRARMLLNPERTVSWSTDKAYLPELGASNIPVVPTRSVQPGDLRREVPAGEFVVKPSVSAGSKDTALFRRGEVEPAEVLVSDIRASGRQALVQPYLASVDSRGETAVVFVGGRFSHAIRKGPLLTRGRGPVAGLFAAEEIRPREPSPAEMEVAARCVEYVTDRFGAPVYARVDLVEDDEGRPLVLELELAEPSLFFGFAPQAADALAAEVAAAIGATSRG